VGTVRFALTRGNQVLAGSDLIPEVSAWQSSLSPTPPAPLDSLLATPDEASGAFGFGGYYDTQANAVLPGYSFADLPAHYIYAQVYVNQAMKQGVGAAVRFPCDPNLPDGAGCLGCRFLLPTNNPMDAFGNPQGPFDDPSVSGDVPNLANPNPNFNFNFVGIECSYRPSNVLMDPIVGLLQLLTGNAGASMIVMTRSKSFSG
ncbi:MAG: hypothetical protein KDD53_07370, partial [Bdellovibrionales bacterium]|nr:hypothetical protein [Bdellovibrionales bacterium]